MAATWATQWLVVAVVASSHASITSATCGDGWLDLMPFDANRSQLVRSLHTPAGEWSRDRTVAYLRMAKVASTSFLRVVNTLAKDNNQTIQCTTADGSIALDSARRTSPLMDRCIRVWPFQGQKTPIFILISREPTSWLVSSVSVCVCK